MAWVKIPAENHPLFLDALPKDPRISTLKMFGGIAAKVNGMMFSGLFARSVMAKLSPVDQQEAMKLDGSAPFDPMGNGRVMLDTLLLGEEVMDDPRVLRDWLRRSFAFALTLPPKTATKTKSAPKPVPTAKAKPAATARSAAKAKPAAKARSAAKAKPAAKAKRVSR
jgi:TfoX/Sxy family transcriptional regulator of competence genes